MTINQLASKGSGTGNRTRVSAVRGPRPRPLDESAMLSGVELNYCFQNIAEAGGFEPPERLPVRQFSKLLVSATHPNFLFWKDVFSQTRCKCRETFWIVQTLCSFFCEIIDRIILCLWILVSLINKIFLFSFLLFELKLIEEGIVDDTDHKWQDKMRAIRALKNIKEG